MGRLRQGTRVVLCLALAGLLPSVSFANNDNKDEPADEVQASTSANCETPLVEPPKTTRSKKKDAPAPQARATQTSWTLKSFLAPGEHNLAVQHPFTVANAPEKAYAMINHVPPRDALDPLYRIKPIKIYPMLAGEHPATGGRMVVGQEEAVATFVAYLASVARGDRTGKSLGFPGPAGTGKTELLYTLSNLEKNLGKEAKYRQYSYRWKGLYTIPYLKHLHRFTDGEPMSEYLDPDMLRSPFTLLRADMQEEVLGKVRKEIFNKWGVTIADGWTNPEPKSAKIIQVIFQHEFPDIANGSMSIDDLTHQQYLDTLSKYLVIVPKTSIRPVPLEPQIIRAQTDNPNYQALFAAPNIARLHTYGQSSPFSVDFTGKVFQQDGSLLMIDELFRNPGEFLNILLEVIQNHVAETDFGDPVTLDVLPIWNSNDESIEKAHEDNAIKALIDRTDAPAMRSLLPANQIESVILFQVGLKRFKMRKLSETELTPLNHAEVYPATDSFGKTQSAQGRYALYYDMDGEDILIAPYTLNYMAWLASSTRFVTDVQKMQKYAGEINLVRGTSGLLTNAVDRLKINLGEKTVERADLMELSRLRNMLAEGQFGISARDIETWMKESLNIAKNSGKKVLTPLMVDQAFQKLIDEKRIKPPKDEIRAAWQLLRQNVKLELLLPKLDQEVTAIVSGDGHKAERMYDEIEKQFIALATDRDAKEVEPEDGSQRILIDQDRLLEIRRIYLEKFGRDFEPTFLLRQLPSARRGTGHRDPDLLEAVRIFISRHYAYVVDDISSLDSYYRGESKDPNIRQKAAEIEPMLAMYGYDQNSFRQAVNFVAQLKQAERLARRK